MKLHITRLVHEIIDMPVSRDPQAERTISIGETIEDLLAENAIDGSDIHDLSLEVPPEDWHVVKGHYRTEYAKSNSLPTEWVDSDQPPPSVLKAKAVAKAR